MVIGKIQTYVWVADKLSWAYDSLDLPFITLQPYEYMKIPQSITLFHGIMKFNIIAFFKALENNFVNSYFGLTRSWKLGISLMRDPSYKNVWQ